MIPLLALVSLFAFGFTETGNALAEAVGETAASTVDPGPTEAEIAAQQAEAEYQRKLENQRKATRRWQLNADYWAHKLKRHVRHQSLPITNSLAYEKLRTKNWMKRAKALKAKYKKQQAIARMWAARNSDFDLALRAAAKRYGVSYNWLHACAKSEGHIEGRRTPGGPIDPFIMNHGGSGAGGWMQFMHPTFYGYVGRTSGYPSKYKKWNSKVGQAYTAAYIFKTEGSRQWTGAGC